MRVVNAALNVVHIAGWFDDPLGLAIFAKWSLGQLPFAEFLPLPGVEEAVILSADITSLGNVARTVRLSSNDATSGVIADSQFGHIGLPNFSFTKL